MSPDALYHIDDVGTATVVHFDYSRMADEARTSLYDLVESQGKASEKFVYVLFFFFFDLFI